MRVTFFDKLISFFESIDDMCLVLCSRVGWQMYIAPDAKPRRQRLALLIRALIIGPPRRFINIFLPSLGQPPLRNCSIVE
eukprot:COSAG03_NODE_3804_length_1822_cov_2.834591_3_plen_80_part_00